MGGFTIFILTILGLSVVAGLIACGLVAFAVWVSRDPEEDA